MCTWTFARHGSWNRAECHAAEQHFPLLLLLLLLLLLVVVDPLSLSCSSQYTLTSTLLPSSAAADATFSCGQRLHCISHLRLISAKSRVVVSQGLSTPALGQRSCYASKQGTAANDQEPMYMQGSARVVTFGGQDGGAGSPTCCKGLLPARGQLPAAPAGTVPFPGENMGRWRERWALRCILVTGQTGPSWQGQLKCEIWEEKLAFCAYYTFPPGLVVGF